MNNNSLYIKKDGDTAWTDSLATWNIGVVSIPSGIAFQAKEPYHNDWHDEDERDTWTGNRVYINTDDLTIELACKGAPGTCCATALAFRDYLTGATDGKPLLTLYSPWTHQEYTRMYIQSFSDDTFWQDGHEECLTWKAVFRKIS